MLSTLKQPKWAVAAVVVVGLAVSFIFLGFWQLDRRQERLSDNALATTQLLMPPTPLADLLAQGDDRATIEYRRATVDGSYLTADEVLIRSQIHLGTAGFHVITPYAYEGGTVLVNRGWVPLDMDTTPVNATPAVGPVEGWIHLTQERGPLSPEDPPGQLTVFNRVDIDRIEQQTSSDLDPVYVVLADPEASELPIPVDLPDFSDEGPHLAYAIQWFGFAIVAVVGFGALLRKSSRTRSAQ